MRILILWRTASDDSAFSPDVVLIAVVKKYLSSKDPRRIDEFVGCHSAHGALVHLDFVRNIAQDEWFECSTP